MLLSLAGFEQAARGQASRRPPQSPPSVSVHATVDSQRILVGQPIRLLLEAHVQGNAPLIWPALDSLPHFEFITRGQIDSVIRSDGRDYRQYITVTSFDSGTWAIPRLAFTISAKKAVTDSVRIAVDFSKFDPQKDYHDIRDIVDLPNPYARWVRWVVIFVTSVSLVFVIWMIRRKRPIVVTAPPRVAAPRLSPYEEAMGQLEEIVRLKLAEHGPVKQYYTRLNDILRLFVLRRLGIASLSETNEELIGQIRQLPVGPDAFSRLSEALRVSDFVKFAKYQPGNTDNEYQLTVIRSSIEVLQQVGNDRDAERARRLTENANNNIKI
jgi:hypothetical protein